MVKNLKNTKGFKIFSLNAVSVFCKMLVGFAVVKLYANVLGPQGFAFLGNFKNFTNFFKQLSTLGYDSGVVALVAENKENKNKLSEIFSTSFFSRLIFSLVIATLILVFHNYLNQILLEGSFSFRFVIILFSFFLPFFSLNTLIVSYLNGLGKFKKVIFINIIASFVGFLFTLYFVWYHGLLGGLISLAVIESIIVLPTLLFFKKEHVSISYRKIKKSILGKLYKFSLMTLTSAIVINTSHFLIRTFLIDRLSIQTAGYWEAMMRFSNYYMMIISSGLTLYYLPKFAEINSAKDLIQEIKRYLWVVMPLAVCFFLGIYFFREKIVVFIFNDSFSSVADFFKYYLLGDFLKVISIIFGYRILAKGMVVNYIVIELSFYISYVLGTCFLLYFGFDAQSVVMSYFYSNVISLILMMFLYRFSIIPNTQMLFRDKLS